MKLPIVPEAVQALEVAFERLPDLTRNMLDKERERAKQGSDVRGNIMSMLVRLSDGRERRQRRLGPISGALPQTTEISGNMFIFTAAGFETTGTTMSYAVTALAAYPQWQEWIQAEIDRVMGEYEEDETPTTQPSIPS